MKYQHFVGFFFFPAGLTLDKKKNLIMNVVFFLIAYSTVSCISEHEFSLFLNLSFQIDKIIKTSVFIKEQTRLDAIFHSFVKSGRESIISCGPKNTIQELEISQEACWEYVNCCDEMEKR